MAKLTAASVLKYRPGKTRREIPDDRSAGLRLIIQVSGAKSWAVRFRRPGDAKPVKMTLGTVDFADSETVDAPQLGAPLSLAQARVLAASIARQRAQGIDPAAAYKAAKARARTAAVEHAASPFGAAAVEFVAEYKTRRGSRPRRLKFLASMLGLYLPTGADLATVSPEVVRGGLAEAWADRPVATIDSHDIHAVVSEARKAGGNSRARHLHSALSVLFGWLLRNRRITANPVTGVYKPSAGPSRERVLSDDEIRWMWAAAENIGGPFGAVYRLLLLTGARLKEVSGMTAGELDKDGTWTIGGHRVKNHRSHTLVLPALALRIISEAPPIENEGGYLFTTNGKTPISGFSKAKRQLDAEMERIAGRPIEPWRIHDLRRSAATGLAALGIQLPVIERLLNHVSGPSFGGVAGIYQRHEYASEKREALQRWAAHVEGLVSGKPANVTKLSDKKRRRR